MGNNRYQVSCGRAQLLAEITLFTGLFCAMPSAPAAGTAPTQDTQGQSAKAFVQGFYDWYTAAIQKDDNSAMDGALKSKRWPFSLKLVAALKADEAAQAKSADEVVGLDFDPYLNAQDTCFPYKTGKAGMSGNQYRVEVFDSHCDNSHPEIPTVIAVIEKDGDSWRFVNFIYPGEPGQVDSDLLTVLKTLKQEREHPDENLD